MARCDTYAFGNCTWGVCELAPWVPEGLGDGGDWAANAPSHGLQVTEVPTFGSVVCYCRGNGYSDFGHVGYVEAIYRDGTFLVKEMNYIAFDGYDERVSNMSDVCGFILQPGTAPGQGAGPPSQPALSNAWAVAHEWDKVRWFLSFGSNIAQVHYADLTRWFDSVGRV